MIGERKEKRSDIVNEKDYTVARHVVFKSCSTQKKMRVGLKNIGSYCSTESSTMCMNNVTCEANTELL